MPAGGETAAGVGLPSALGDGAAVAGDIAGGVAGDAGASTGTDAGGAPLPSTPGVPDTCADAPSAPSPQALSDAASAAEVTTRIAAPTTSLFVEHDIAFSFGDLLVPPTRGVRRCCAIEKAPCLVSRWPIERK
jgi:hypothetical protein